MYHKINNVYPLNKHYDYDYNCGHKQNTNSLTKYPNKKTKMILCKNYLQKNYCDFNKNCKYAHGIKDQQTTSLRKKVYDLITSIETNRFKIDDNYLLSNNAVEDELLILTKLCKKCQLKACVGGLNCKKGAYNENYLICKDNLINSNCVNDKCSKIHLRENVNDLKNISDSDTSGTSDISSASGTSNISGASETSNVSVVNVMVDQDCNETCDKYFMSFSEEILESSSSNNLSSDNSCFDSDELGYLYESSSSSDDLYKSIFD